MAQNSKIEWTHHTGNLWWGCTKVHAGCDNCYAETLANRYGGKIWGPDAPRKATKGVWGEFMRWQAIAASWGEVHRVFVGSMMDIFEKPMPVVDWNGNPMVYNAGAPLDTSALRDRFFETVVPACPNLMFLLLTKRPSNINRMIPEAWRESPPDNVMFGTSPVDPATFKTLVDQLKKVKGRRFLSIEPQLERIIPTYEQLSGIDWVIQGGESGPKRRPFNTDWAREMRDICAVQGVPYFFKQVDKVLPIPEDLMVREFPA